MQQGKLKEDDEEGDTELATAKDDANHDEEATALLSGQVAGQDKQ